MKALCYHGPEDVRYEEVRDARIEDDADVLVRMTRCGICGSDLHIYHGHVPLEGCPSIGHEAIGEIVEVGRAVRRFRTGDKIMLSAMVGCGLCDPCRSGHMLRCARGQMSGYGYGMGLAGCQAEAIRVPMADFNAAPIPDGMTDDQALLLTDNLPTAYAACKRADIVPGATVGIIGLGPIGLLAVKLAQAMGAGLVVAIDVKPEKRVLAEALGAVAFGPEEATAQVAALTRGAMLDSVVEAVGGSATVDLALRLVGRMRTVSVLGNGTQTRIDFPPDRFMYGINFHVMYATEVWRYWPELVPLVLAGRLRPEEVVTHSFPLAVGADAYARYAARMDGMLKPVLVPA